MYGNKRLPFLRTPEYNSPDSSKKQRLSISYENANIETDKQTLWKNIGALELQMKKERHDKKHYYHKAENLKREIDEQIALYNDKMEENDRTIFEQNENLENKETQITELRKENDRTIFEQNEKLENKETQITELRKEIEDQKKKVLELSDNSLLKKKDIVIRNVIGELGKVKKELKKVKYVLSVITVVLCHADTSLR